MANAPHPLDIATQLEPVGTGRFRGRTLDDYWNMVGQLGGLTNAQLIRAVLDDPRCKGAPVAQTVNFCGAMTQGEFEIECKLARSGKTTQHWSLSLTQGENVIATGSVVTASRQPTWSKQFAEAPSAPPPETLAPFEFEGFMAWPKRIDFRFVEGAFELHEPAAKVVKSPRSLVWLQHQPARAVDFVSLATLIDVFFLRIAQIRGYIVPMGTVTLTSYFHATEQELRAYGSAYLLGVADARLCRDSWGDQTCELWAPDGRLLASGTQLAWYRE
jgi:acyl-CoA thioesterase